MNVNLEFICPSADDVATSFSLMISDPSDLPDIIMKALWTAIIPAAWPWPTRTASWRIIPTS